MTTEEKIPVLAVVGPTASGKTGLGVMLAQQYRGEVISADSMQIYEELDIATAKPTPEEQQGDSPSPDWLCSHGTVIQRGRLLVPGKASDSGGL